MSHRIRNVVTLIAGVVGGIYMGENLPDIYYYELMPHLPVLNIQESSKPLITIKKNLETNQTTKLASDSQSVKSQLIELGDTPVKVFATPSS